MKAVVVREFGGPEVLQVEDVPDPTPAAGQVLVRVKAIGVNPVDTYIRSGAYARKPALPYIPHTDYAGIVERVGSDVAEWTPGDRVYAHAAAPGSGAAAELAVSEAAQLHPLPAGITFQQGAAIGVPYGTAWRALFIRAQARPGETVFVHGGSGGVGTAAIQIARLYGMRVIATAGTEQGMRLAREQGAHQVLNHRQADYLQALLPLNGGHGADVVLEMLANVNLDRDLDVLAPRGRVVVIGNRGRIEIDPRKTMGKDAAILGMTLFNAGPDELREIHAGIGAGLERGALTPVVGREFPLAEAGAAHRAVMEPGAYGKIVIVP
jgi:NADPH2:quinone reductase